MSQSNSIETAGVEVAKTAQVSMCADSLHAFRGELLSVDPGMPSIRQSYADTDARTSAAKHLPGFDLADSQKLVAGVIEKEITSGNAGGLQREVERFQHDPDFLKGAVADVNKDLQKYGIDATFSIGQSFMDERGQTHPEGMLRAFNQQGGAEIIAMTDPKDGMLVGSVSKNKDGSFSDHVTMRGDASAALHEIVSGKHN